MRRTREEKAITLIALIITIVVLLILAVVAINAVTGDGIIQHATNAKTEYEKAQYKEEDMLSYYEGVLQSGEVVPTVEQLQEKYEFIYFSSLKRAIENVNGTENTEADVTKENVANAVVGLYEDNGSKYVVLMKDTEESATINVNENVTINLGGKTLLLTADAAHLNFAADTECTIDGRLGGSSIQKNIDDGQSTGIIVGDGKSLDIKSGKYIMKGKYNTTEKLYVIKINNSNNKFELNNASIMLLNNATVSSYSRGIVLSAKESVINNCSFNISSVTGGAGGIYVSTGNAELNSCSVKVSSDTGNSYGLINFADTELTIKDTNIFADASDNNNNGVAGVGIKNQGGTIKFYSGTVEGTYCGYYAGEDSENYIYGATISGQGSYGLIVFYKTGKTYIENATIMTGSYTGKYDFSNFTGEKGKAILVNDTNKEKDTNIYIDNCDIKGLIECLSIKNRINISNSKVNGNIEIVSGQVINIGEGMTKDELIVNGSINETGLSYKGYDKILMTQN